LPGHGPALAALLGCARELLLTAEERAEQHRQEVARERRRADNERQRAERLAARLRELGVDPDQLP
jgi:hypothetical protein